ncbi:MAG: spore coat protein CotJB [Ruminococcus bromii]|nr:spore coat protein CotJB [Ruminococcus bromii]
MNEQSRLRRRISSIQFAMWELHLYLDSHPYCAEAAKKLAEYREQYRKLKTDYEDQYGPLNETSRDTNRWAWISDPWPWDAEANE